jgi:hypothetical protein
MAPPAAGDPGKRGRLARQTSGLGSAALSALRPAGESAPGDPPINELIGRRIWCGGNAARQVAAISCAKMPRH